MSKFTAKKPDQKLLESFFLPSLMNAKEYFIDTPPVTIKLDQNESPYDWPDALKEKITSKLKDVAWNRYPSAFSGNITNLLAKYAGVPEDCLLTGPGTNYLLSLVISCLSRKIQGKVIIARPSFPLYESHCQYDGIPYEVWPLNDDLEYDLKKLPEVPKHSLIIFASPNNPVGNALSKNDLEHLLAEHPTSIFLADEAYFEFADEQYTDLLSKYSNLIILRTCSKTLGAAGIRLGYVIAHHDYISIFQKLRLPYLLNQFTLVAAEAFLTDTSLHEFVEKNVNQTKQERNNLIASLSQIAETSNFKVKDSQANFFLMKWNSQQECLDAYKQLVGEGILVRNISAGPGLEGCLRVTVGNTDENKAFLQAAKKCFSKS